MREGLSQASVFELWLHELCELNYIYIQSLAKNTLGNTKICM